MAHEIEKHGDYFVITFKGEVYDRASFEFGYSLLTEYADRGQFKAVVCDLSSVKSVKITQADVKYVSTGLIYLFLKNKSFRIVDVVPNSELRDLIEGCHTHLAGYDICRASITHDMDSALQIINNDQV